MVDPATPDSGLSRSGARRGRRWIVGLTFSAVALSIFASWWLIWFDPGRQVETELARIRALGEPVTPDDLEALHPFPPAERDTTKHWLAAVSKVNLPTTADSPEGKLVFIGEGEVQPAPGERWPEIDVAQAYLEQQSGALEALYQVAERDGTARYPVRYHDGGAALVPHLQQLRAAARVLRLDARVRAHRGDAAGSARSIRAILAAGRTLEREPLWSSQAVRNSIIAIAIEEFRVLLPVVSFSEKDLASLQTDFRSGDHQEALYRAMVGNRVLGIQTLQHPAAAAKAFGKPTTTIAVLAQVYGKDDMRLFLESMREQVVAAKLPWAESVRLLASPSTNIEETPWFRHRAISIWPTSSDGFFLHVTRGAALSRSAEAASAVERFRRRENRLPIRLDELVPEFLPAVPQDPFTDRPLKYKIENDGYVVYSLGRDLTDNDGDDRSREEGSLDVVFRVRSPHGE